MQFYVYAIFGPDGCPRYIGKGSGYRWQHHARFSHNRGLSRLYREAGGDLPIVKIREGLSEADAFAVERALIAAIGRGTDGPLLNLSPGGDGHGGPKSPEAIANMRANHWSKKSPQTKDKIGAALKGKPKSGAHKAALSRAAKGRKTGPASEHRREGIRKALLAFWDSRRQQGLPLRHAREGLS